MDGRITKPYTGAWNLSSDTIFSNALTGPSPEDCLCGVGTSTTSSPQGELVLADPFRLTRNIAASYWSGDIDPSNPAPDIEPPVTAQSFSVQNPLFPIALIVLGFIAWRIF